MQYIGDRDGKSTTSSAVDKEHYPDLNGREEKTTNDLGGHSSHGAFSHSEIEARAHDIWIQAGRPEGTQDRDWYEAERQLAEARRDRTDTATMAAQAGSVQR